MTGLDLIGAAAAVAAIFAGAAIKILSGKQKSFCTRCFADIAKRLEDHEKAIEEQRNKATEHGVEIRGIYKRIDEVKADIKGLQEDIKEFLQIAYKLLGTK